jgi:hypothetical protein
MLFENSKPETPETLTHLHPHFYSGNLASIHFREAETCPLIFQALIRGRLNLVFAAEELVNLWVFLSNMSSLPGSNKAAIPSSALFTIAPA